MSETRRFLLVNPRSGDEDPSAEELIAAARERGVETHLLTEGDDACELARKAAAGGAAVGIAGGDGSIAPVAGVAVESGKPFVCIPFGTRNHFGLDLGLDADDPIGALSAFDGVECRVDIGRVGERWFVNNVSLDLYVEVDGKEQHHSTLVALVANNAYELRSMADLGERKRLDEGRLHAYVIEAVSRRALLALLGRAAFGRIERAEGWSERSAERFRLEARRDHLHAAVDGEAVVLSAPVEFELRPRALVVLVPPRPA